jgi:hypothetical protein
MTVSAALVAFDERRANPTVNLGTLGSAGDVVWTGTRTLTPADVAYVAVPGVAGNGMTVPDFTLGTNQEWVFRINYAGAWPSASRMAVVGQWGAQLAYFIAPVDTTGRIIFGYSLNGSSALTSFSAVLAASPEWVKITRNSSTGAILFYTGTSGTNTPPVSWTNQATGGTETAGAIHNSTDLVTVGALGDALNTNPLHAIMHRVIVKDDIDGADLLDVDTSVLTSMTATSFTATTGQTVSIARSTGATYKTEIVLPGIPSRILNGTSDYGEVADLAGLDFSNSQSFTVWALVQAWATFGTNDAIVSKKADTTDTTAGWSLGNGPSTAAQVRAEIGDGSAGVGCTTSASRTSGALTLVSLIRDVTADTIAAAIDGTIATPVTDTTTGSLANSEVVRFGRLSGAGTEYVPLRVFAWGIHPYAMTSAQLTALRTALINGSNSGSGTRTADLSIPTRTLELTA